MTRKDMEEASKMLKNEYLFFLKFRKFLINNDMFNTHADIQIDNILRSIEDLQYRFEDWA